MTGGSKSGEVRHFIPLTHSLTHSLIPCRGRIMRAIRSEESEVRPSPATCTIKTLTYITKIKHSDLSLISSSSFSCLLLFLMSLTIRYDNLVTYCRSSDQKTRDVLVHGIVAACVLITVAVFIVICWRRESRIKRSSQLSVLLSSKSDLKRKGRQLFSKV